MATIETIHRATIFYEAKPDVVEAVENKAFSLQGDLEVETMCGNGCCSPHIMVEGSSLKDVNAWVKKVESYITRRKGAELIPTT
ncbi:hypothetical protein HGO34_15935 [Agrobacterium vitis]|uniref:hypothetical protein n=1 Tax=Agrobacterium vitis TaxID=373 RepID=UPI001F1FFB7D|nr:hypothetical protein [Agrobacterium vitis]MCF1498885.1 hypothetical protein [Allorhizobium sp. Av2]MCM2441213.1 hypothetical protein [Agrobacterium vitis]